jgi:phage shock protein E
VTTPNLIAIGALALGGLLVLRTLINRTKRISKEDLMELIAQGAQIVDVRTPQEFAQAHVKGSRNIPLDQLMHRAAELDRAKPVVVCCASGARSSMAKTMLERAGFSAVHNAGPWQCVAPLLA